MNSWLYQRSKRVADFCVALLLLLLLSPLLVGLGLAILLESGGPVLFRQARGGFQGRVFNIVKFRTMRDTRDASGELLPDSERITAVGRLMRALSLDELPEVWNILNGDMSFVGPRPFIADYLPLYTEAQARRHSVRPGLSGWAQVNGRNALAWEERFKLDLWYVDHCSHWVDLKIVVMTFGKVLRREGVNQSETVTAERFRGSAPDPGGPGAGA